MRCQTEISTQGFNYGSTDASSVPGRINPKKPVLPLAVFYYEMIKYLLLSNS